MNSEPTATGGAAPCSQCGYTGNPDDALYCEDCGAALQAPASTHSDAVDAQTRQPDTKPPPWAKWRCSCGQENSAGEGFCDACGDPRPTNSPMLRPADRIDAFEVVAQIDEHSYSVGYTAEGAAAGQGTALSARLCLMPSDSRDVLAATIRALDAAEPAAEPGHELVPAILGEGESEMSGPYLILSRPEGDWQPLAAAGTLGGRRAAAFLRQVLTLVQRAADAGRLLIATPHELLVDGDRAFLPTPTAPALPLDAALLADPTFVAPEVSGGERHPDAWLAGAYGAGALLHAAVSNALGFPAEWYALMRALLARDPAQRPRSLEEVELLLAGAAEVRAVSRHRTGFRTDIGYHHAVNQDAGGVWSWPRADGVPVTLAVVADGVSAGTHSEVAAQLAVEKLRAAFEAASLDAGFDVDSAERVLLEAALEAHREIAATPFENYEEANATTLVAACVFGGELRGIWCGDSRAYGVTPDGCLPLTKDHSWVNLMVDSGRATLDQALRDPRAHVIARWLGASQPPKDDPGFDRFSAALAPGDRVLLCSDGLYMYFEPPAEPPDSMARVVLGQGDGMGEAVDDLVQRALDGGGVDNITVALIAVE